MWLVEVRVPVQWGPMSGGRGGGGRARGYPCAERFNAPWIIVTCTPPAVNRQTYMNEKISFRQKSCQIIGFCRRLRGWCPLPVWEILDPPLVKVEQKAQLLSSYDRNVSILGAFLVPYFITVFLIGIPAFAIEVFVGQFMGTGGFGAWKIVPLMQGKLLEDCTAHAG